MLTSLLLAAFLIAASVGGLFVYRWYRNRNGGFEDYTTSQVAPIGRGSLLWVLRSTGRASAGYTRLLLTDLAGRVLREQQDLGRAGRLYSVEGDQLFFEDQSAGLCLRSAADLSLRSSLREAVAHHPPLDRGYEVVGSVPSGLILRGRDRHLYRVSLEGQVERFEGEAHHPLPRAREADRLGLDLGTQTFPPLDPEAPTLRLPSLDLVRPAVVMDWEHRAPVTFASAAAYLVVSSDVVGAGANDLLSRVSQAGEIAWTAPAQSLLGEHALPGRPRFRVVWAELRGGLLRAVVEASVRRSSESHSGYTLYERRLVELDPAGGQVRARHPLHRPEE